MSLSAITINILVIHCILVGASRIEIIKSERLAVFQPGDGLMTLWFESISNPSAFPNNDEEADEKLRIESCNETVHARLYKGSLDMCEAYEASQRKTSNCPTGFLAAECKAVYMYSTDFYDTYNTNVRNWQWNNYKIYTSLLYNAVVKLARLRPLPPNAILYRGLRGDMRTYVSPIHFAHFTSTSLDLAVAEGFGNGTLIRIKTDDIRLGADLRGLVQFEIEQEVLLTPFETFDVINQFQMEDRTILNLKSSPKQYFLTNVPKEVHGEL